MHAMGGTSGAAQLILTSDGEAHVNRVVVVCALLVVRILAGQVCVVSVYNLLTVIGMSQTIDA